MTVYYILLFISTLIPSQKFPVKFLIRKWIIPLPSCFLNNIFLPTASSSALYCMYTFLTSFLTIFIQFRQRWLVEYRAILCQCTTWCKYTAQSTRYGIFCTFYFQYKTSDFHDPWNISLEKCLNLLIYSEYSICVWLQKLLFLVTVSDWISSGANKQGGP